MSHKRATTTRRWKVRCVNWRHHDYPHAVAYQWDDRSGMSVETYFATWDEAMRHVDRSAR